MRDILPEAISALVESLCVRACCVLPADVASALAAALAAEAPGSPAYATLEQLLINQRLARDAMRPICQDTGLAVVFADVGRDVHIDGDL